MAPTLSPQLDDLPGFAAGQTINVGLGCIAHKPNQSIGIEQESGDAAPTPNAKAIVAGPLFDCGSFVRPFNRTFARRVSHFPTPTQRTRVAERGSRNQHRLGLQPTSSIGFGRIILSAEGHKHCPILITLSDRVAA